MKKVLIVDDASFMRMTIRTILERNGFQVIGEAENGKVGVEMYKALSPDIVTMDITMPEMDGIQAVKMIKQGNPEAKILMITAMGQEFMVRDAINAGAKGFLVKPFKDETIVKTLSNM